ncbi:MAG: membrane protein [Pacific salmon nidovirus]|uniref:Membrane protein n=1 Tax=Pacific salmon nidovirus TaxID=2587487 RepID=A0AAE6M792_9NIDO|nr:MAG: membrane protein [Pacific salmon nidovirus]QEG08241.1 MAG: membrane protein [Pacific salmon nidovirus]
MVRPVCVLLCALFTTVLSSSSENTTLFQGISTTTTGGDSGSDVTIAPNVDTPSTTPNGPFYGVYQLNTPERNTYIFVGTLPPPIPEAPIPSAEARTPEIVTDFVRPAIPDFPEEYAPEQITFDQLLDYIFGATPTNTRRKRSLPEPMQSINYTELFDRFARPHVFKHRARRSLDSDNCTSHTGTFLELSAIFATPDQLTCLTPAEQAELSVAQFALNGTLTIIIMAFFFLQVFFNSLADWTLKGPSKYLYLMSAFCYMVYMFLLFISTVIGVMFFKFPAFLAASGIALAIACYYAFIFFVRLALAIRTRCVKALYTGNAVLCVNPKLKNAVPLPITIASIPWTFQVAKYNDTLSCMGAKSKKVTVPPSSLRLYTAFTSYPFTFNLETRIGRKEEEVPEGSLYLFSRGIKFHQSTILNTELRKAHIENSKTVDSESAKLLDVDDEDV